MLEQDTRHTLRQLLGTVENDVTHAQQVLSEELARGSQPEVSERYYLASNERAHYLRGRLESSQGFLALICRMLEG